MRKIYISNFQTERTNGPIEWGDEDEDNEWLVKKKNKTKPVR